MSEFSCSECLFDTSSSRRMLLHAEKYNHNYKINKYGMEHMPIRYNSKGQRIN